MIQFECQVVIQYELSPVKYTYNHLVVNWSHVINKGIRLLLTRTSERWKYLLVILVTMVTQLPVSFVVASNCSYGG